MHNGKLISMDAGLPSLGEGNTPLLPSRRIGKALGMPYLYFKWEGLNPTGSFKDRGSVLVVGKALQNGKNGVLTASTGNAGASLAAYCARYGLRCVILADADSPQNKLTQAMAYGAECLRIKNIFARPKEELISLLASVAVEANLEVGFFWAPVLPYIVEGMKKIAFEAVKQLGNLPPDWVISPVAGGDLLAGQWLGYQGLAERGEINRLPKMVGVQGSGAAPLVKGWLERSPSVPTIAEARTVASGLKVTYSGDHALKAIYQSGGLALAVEDDQILCCQHWLAEQEGIWVEPTGAVPLAALQSLLERGQIDPGERVVCVLTGAGFKDVFALDAGKSNIPAVNFDESEILKCIQEEGKAR